MNDIKCSSFEILFFCFYSLIINFAPKWTFCLSDSKPLHYRQLCKCHKCTMMGWFSAFAFLSNGIQHYDKYLILRHFAHNYALQSLYFRCSQIMKINIKSLETDLLNCIFMKDCVKRRQRTIWTFISKEA